MTEWGERVAGLLEVTRCTLVDVEPWACERVASYLFALLEREPLHSRPGWEAERIVLGTIAWDLREIAVRAGEPVGAQRDLRDARTKAEEHDARERIDAAAAGYDAHITAAIEADRLRRLPPSTEESSTVRESFAAPSVPEPVAPASDPASDGIPAWL